jgi:ABC-2 type transport system permease protein
MMPGCLRVIARGNPLKYLVDALRALTVPGGRSAFALGGDVEVLFVTLVVLVVIAGRLCPSVAR